MEAKIKTPVKDNLEYEKNWVKIVAVFLFILGLINIFSQMDHSPL